MGWCSGTDIFDDVASAVLQSNASEEDKYKILYSLAQSLENDDWDCQGDSSYLDNPLVR